MTGGRTHITDASTASRTMLFDVAEGDWCPELVDLFDLDLSILPTISDSTISGVLTDPESFQGIRASLSGVLVDQQAALLGQACVTPGSVKTTYGTGCFMILCFILPPIYFIQIVKGGGDGKSKEDERQCKKAKTRF